MRKSHISNKRSSLDPHNARCLINAVDILWTNRIKRPVVSPTCRENYLRLDKNEQWVILIKNNWRYIKKISFHKITAYPDQYKLYKIISKINRLNINQLVLTPDQLIKLF